MNKKILIIIMSLSLMTTDTYAQTAFLRNAFENAFEFVVKKFTKKSATDIVQEVGESGLKGVVKEGGEEIVEKGVRESTSELAENATQNAFESLETTFIKEGIETVTSKNALEIISRNLSKAASDKWLSLVKDNTEWSKRLAKDILRNGDLVEALNKNPELIKSYIRCIDAPVFRTDVSMLRYMNGRSSLFSAMIQKSAKFRIVVQDGKNCITNGAGEIVGTIRHYGDGYAVQVAKDNNMLLNMPLLPNSQYRVSRESMTEVIRTNSDGLTSVIDVAIDGTKYTGPNPTGRSSLIKKFRDVFKEMTLDGHMNSKNHNLADDGGHIIPRSWGGLDEGSNLFAQNHTFNVDGKGDWQIFEQAGAKALANGKNVKLHIEFTYPKNSMRPSTVLRKQIHDGKVICNQLMENVMEFQANV